jgi:hypothetical protein
MTQFRPLERHVDVIAEPVHLGLLASTTSSATSKNATSARRYRAHRDAIARRDIRHGAR